MAAFDLDSPANISPHYHPPPPLPDLQRRYCRGKPGIVEDFSIGKYGTLRWASGVTNCRSFCSLRLFTVERFGGSLDAALLPRYSGRVALAACPRTVLAADLSSLLHRSRVLQIL